MQFQNTKQQENRSKMLEIRISPEELNSLKEISKKSGDTVSTFTRKSWDLYIKSLNLG